MSQSPRHGAPGCPCEECLTARIAQSAARAADGRDMSGLRTRLDSVRGRIEGRTEILVSAS
jgi:hypothetical protein